MSNTVIDLKPFSLTRREKVRWRFADITSVDQILPSIPSKSVRKLLSNWKTLLEQNQITYHFEEMTAEKYHAWLPYYQEKMAENQHEFLATPEWFAERMADQKKIDGLFLYQGEKMVGSAIFTREGTEKGTFAFKASDRLDLSNDKNSSIGVIIDYLFIQFMVEQKVKIISSGRSRNAFGVINTLGYLDYKLRFGYHPSPAQSSPVLETVPVNDEGIVLFYGEKAGSLALYALKPKGLVKQFEQARFATPELPFIELEY